MKKINYHQILNLYKMANYFLVENGQQVGPFSYEQLSTKVIFKDTLVWTAELDTWTQAGYLPILKEIITQTPPPIPNAGQRQNTTSVSPPPVPKSLELGYFGYQLAKRRERFMANMIEAVILLGIMMILTKGKYWEYQDDIFKDISTFMISLVLSGVFGAIYGAIFYPIWSGNLGHRIMGLKVISTVDGKEVNTRSCGGYREMLKSTLGYLIFPVLWFIWDEKRQNLYDKICDTIVVRKK
jgi:uncharacterized RDD family membrane protein YckC